jgi:hypothetical protein
MIRGPSADWLAELVSRHMIDRSDAHEMMSELAINLARCAYPLD